MTWQEIRLEQVAFGIYTLEAEGGGRPCSWTSQRDSAIYDLMNALRAKRFSSTDTARSATVIRMNVRLCARSLLQLRKRRPSVDALSLMTLVPRFESRYAVDARALAGFAVPPLEPPPIEKMTAASAFIKARIADEKKGRRAAGRGSRASKRARTQSGETADDDDDDDAAEHTGNDDDADDNDDDDGGGAAAAPTAHRAASDGAREPDADADADASTSYEHVPPEAAAITLDDDEPQRVPAERIKRKAQTQSTLDRHFNKNAPATVGDLILVREQMDDLRLATSTKIEKLRASAQANLPVFDEVTRRVARGVARVH